MRTIAFLAAMAASLAPAGGARAEPVGPRAGDTYEITLDRDSSSEGGDGSSSSSHDRDTLFERVVAVRPDGVELEYDLPSDTPAEQRADQWQFPVRIFKPVDGPMRLLDRAGLEARVELWLKAAKWTRAICGHWIFTWNAFRIECGPDSVIETVKAFDLRSTDLREGAPFAAAEALAPAPLTRTRSGPEGATWIAELKIDPGAVRRSRAESDVVLGEIMRKPVTLEAALRERARERVSGTVSVTIDADAGGEVRRRTKVTRLAIWGPDGRSETTTTIETLERRRASSESGRR